MVLSIYSQIEANKTKTWLVMMFFTIFIATVAYLLGEASGYGVSWAGIALIISGLMSLGSYYWSDKIVLSLSGAKAADRKRDFDLYTVTENMAIAAGLPKPKVYVIEDPAPNAFATGRDPNHAVICATRGLIEKLDRGELEGVIAHEMSHIQNFDTRLMAIVSILAGMIVLLSDWFIRMFLWGGRREREGRSSIDVIFMFVSIIFALLSPIIATLIQLAISRRREFLADASAALLTRNPKELANALEVISRDRNKLATATNATAHLFIINPFKGKGYSNWIAGLFNTHPPVEERIKMLRAM